MMTAMRMRDTGSQSGHSRFGLGACLLAAALSLPAVAVPAAAQRERPTAHATGYVIDAELDPAAHHITATAVVSFTAPPALDVVNFSFHPALKITKITDASG